MYKKLLIMLCVAAGMVFSWPACASENSQATAHTKVQLYTNGSNEIIAEINIAPKWHISWQNPGDVGLATTLLLSEDEIRILNQSVPQIRKIYEVMNEYVYENTVYYHLNVPSIDNKLNIFFVECNDVCKQENLSFELSKLQITTSEKWQEIKSTAEKTFPQKIKLISPSDTNRLLFNETKNSNISFIPAENNVIDNDSVAMFPRQQGIEITWQNQNNNKLKQALIISGDNQAFLADIIYSDLPHSSLIYIILLAFLGGIILNAMPCVFPILSLKIFTLIRERRLKNRWPHAIGYTLGVIVCFMILAALLIMLKKQGEAIGWGFQLQSPWFVGIMASIFLILFFFMIDWWHFPVMANRFIHRAAGLNAFTTGFFAVLIASPCTGPFMGAAIGYAFMQSAPILYSVFGALALGYALPYALIVLYPRVISKILPKPGKWMRRLKIILSIPILLTSLWLFSVLTTQLHSSWQNNAVPNLSWKPYNAAEIEELAAQNEKIFIDFTADWCLTCQFNEKILFNSQKFKKFIEANNIHLYKADLTQDDNDYNQALSSYGRDGIPLYVYYHNGEFEILPVFFRLSSLKDKL